MPLTLTTIWTRDKYSWAAGLQLTVTRDEAEGSGAEKLLTLDGGYVFLSGAKAGCVHPSDAIISGASGDMQRAVVGLKSNDTWSWTLQGSRSLEGTRASELECSVCMSPFYEPVRFPAHEDVGPAACGHIFCRGCVVRCLAGGQTCCPLCRAPLAQGMTALAAKRLPIDETIAGETGKIHFKCEPFTISQVAGSPTTAWTATADEDDTTTLPKTITVKKKGGRIRAWSGSTPKNLSNLPEHERNYLLGYVSAAARSETKTGLFIRTREMALGVEPNLLRTASKQDLAIFLAILTEPFWARGGHGNVHIAHGPLVKGEPEGIGG